MINLLSVNIKRIDKELPLPKYETEGSVGFDLICRRQLILEPGTIGLIPANVVVEVPVGYMLIIAPRGSTARKFGLIIPNSIGIIDTDYCGDDDELQIQVWNFTDSRVTVDRGDKIAQGVIVKVGEAIFNEVDKMSDESRGGFGSTDDPLKVGTINLSETDKG